MYKSLIFELHTHGVHVVEVANLDLLGVYIKSRNLILIRKNMPERHKLAVLAHEYIHYLRGHDGHQDEATERIVDEKAARMLISDREYASAENLVGPDPRAIAIELDLPLWLVEAWRPRYVFSSMR